MVFQPRTKDEVRAEMAGRFIARTVNVDTAEGAIALGLLETVADEIEAIEFRQKRIRDAFSFVGAVGTDLDERAASLPKGGPVRQGASLANGTAFALTVIDTAGQTIVPAGTVFGRSDDSTVQYVLTSDVTIPALTQTYTGAAPVVATVAGTRGNALRANMINLVVNGPKNLRSVANTGAIAGGYDRESDDRFKRRCELYVSALFGGQAAALVYQALSWESSTGIRVRHAATWEDPFRPGYTELIVDDGGGFAGYTKAGAVVAGIVPVGGLTQIHHEMPTVEPLDPTTFEVDVAPAVLDPSGQPQWVSVEERGLLYPLPTYLTEGKVWRIHGYSVFTGPLAELQAKVEGNPKTPGADWGWRVSGTRVKVKPPYLQFNDFTANILVATGADLGTAQTVVVGELTAYLQDLAPGTSLYLAALYEHLMRTCSDAGLVNIVFTLPTGDVDPFYPYSAIRAGKVSII